MYRSLPFLLLAIGCSSVTLLTDSAFAEEKRSGTITGVIKTKKPTPNGKNVLIDVLAPGEVKARSYRVLYDPKIKAPIADVLKAVKASNVGDQVELDWIDTGEGLGIKKFEVLKKAEKE